MPQLPLEVEAFLMVGRAIEKRARGQAVRGVIKSWKPTFGHGRQHGAPRRIGGKGWGGGGGRGAAPGANGQMRK